MSSNIRIQRICAYCGKGFEAKTTVTRTCSDGCAKRLYKAKKRTEKVEVSNQETKAVIERPIEQIKARDFLSIQDACKLLGVSRWTVWRAITIQKLNAVKLGSRVVIRRTDIDRLFESPPPMKPPVPVAYELSDCYTVDEVTQKYAVSDKALYDIVKRNNFPKYRKGRLTYVPKVLIDSAFSSIEI